MVNLENKHTGQKREVKIGFSWTVFFFGVFVPLYRSDWKWSIIMFLAAACTFGLSNFVFIFIYNKLYIKDLLQNGYTPADDFSANRLRSEGLAYNFKEDKAQ